MDDEHGSAGVRRHLGGDCGFGAAAAAYTANGSALEGNNWFPLAVASMGILQNVVAAGRKREPKTVGVPIRYKDVIVSTKVWSPCFRWRRGILAWEAACGPLSSPGN
jgi:hypothetical protein